jgi:hypothetical protein
VNIKEELNLEMLGVRPKKLRGWNPFNKSKKRPLTCEWFQNHKKLFINEGEPFHESILDVEVVFHL